MEGSRDAALCKLLTDATHYKNLQPSEQKHLLQTDISKVVGFSQAEKDILEKIKDDLLNSNNFSKSRGKVEKAFKGSKSLTLLKFVEFVAE
jgi:hypothetical protein